MSRPSTFVLVLALRASTLSAATFTVTNTNDSGAGSLRDAITQANTAAGLRSLDNITAGCGAGNYCPGTSANRGQIATFITKTFGLQ